jgi:hypothetical protein
MAHCRCCLESETAVECSAAHLLHKQAIASLFQQMRSVPIFRVWAHKGKFASFPLRRETRPKTEGTNSSPVSGLMGVAGVRAKHKEQKEEERQ